MEHTYKIEDLIPHRDAMLLVEKIIEADTNTAVTSSTASGSWPLSLGNSILPLILIELAAQTAGICNGLERIIESNNSDKTGWLVGVKRSSFYMDEIPVPSTIITRSETTLKYDGFREVSSIIKINGETAAEVILQLFQPGPGDLRDTTTGTRTS